MATTVINLSSLNGTNGFRVSSAIMTNAGDVNGDGIDDVIAGDPEASPNGFLSGSSYVVFGKTTKFDATLDFSELDGTNGFRMDGETEYDQTGMRISSAGDVNGDGFDDVMISARNFDPNSYDLAYSGYSYVVFGKPAGFNATMNLSNLDGNNGFRLDGVDGERSGSSISDAGDVNGDGFDDVIIGALNADSNGENSGSVYVVFGKAGNFNDIMNLSSLDGNNGFRLDGEFARNYVGNVVNNAGDVNGDGFDDLLIGVNNNDPNGPFSGSSYVVFGKATGFHATMNLSSLDGTNGFLLDGEMEFDQSGSSVSSAGDVNGDGFDDVIIGAITASLNGGDSGSSYVVFGKATGFNATMNLSNLDGKNGFRLDGGQPWDEAGLVSGAGDVNGDGFDDLIIGAPGTDPNGESSGSGYVVFGKARGFEATMNLYHLGSDSGFRLDGMEPHHFLGNPVVSKAGDINRDGFDDLIIGAAGAGPSIIGSSYVIFGRSNFIGEHVIQGSEGDDLLKGSSAAERFEAGDGDDMMLGRGGADIFHGGAGNDEIKVRDLDFSAVEGGTDIDVLHLDGKDLNLDLTDYLDKIHNIETICLYGRGDNTLTLTGAELKQLSDTTNTLKVHGNAGDRVILEGNWVDGGSHGFYHTYTQDDAVLLVGMNMTAVVS